MNSFSQMTNEELALSYVEGNNRAFDELLRRTQSELFTYILCVVHDEEMANDIFQETFVKVIMRLHHGRYEAKGKFAAWLVRIAHNVIMDWYRDHQQQNLVEVATDNDLSNFGGEDVLERNIENAYVNDQVMSDVRQLMNGLPPMQREVVYMRFFQQLSFREIAEATGVSINTSLGRMRYALLNMRRMARDNRLELCLE
ncbi:MAG: sigma-70 family RNA polymerase sigma factor [Prevotella sp.]|jgi:RNA polymerase sigma-70 factor (ECF subfamily)|nr:sigma-70 family RNA polymerase sigma factor [Prevotella sp.]MBQ1774191.1 sigma-70 family RNA polymerase sigma factor [Prevotella sp.]